MKAKEYVLEMISEDVNFSPDSAFNKIGRILERMIEESQGLMKKRSGLSFYSVFKEGLDKWNSFLNGLVNHGKRYTMQDWCVFANNARIRQLFAGCVYTGLKEDLLNKYEWEDLRSHLLKFLKDYFWAFKYSDPNFLDEKELEIWRQIK